MSQTLLVKLMIPTKAMTDVKESLHLLCAPVFCFRRDGINLTSKPVHLDDICHCRADH